jgi:FixJ family two-component response regulator
MRDSLRWLIESVGLPVESFESAPAFLAGYDPARPGCCVLDMRMPGMSGLDLQAEMQRRRIVTPVIILTGYAEVSMAVRALKAGAVDFLEKPFSDQVLLDRIHQALAADRTARARAAQRAAIAARHDTLSPREREVMDLVCAGHANREIAAILGLSIKTVEVHRARVMEKMAVDSLADLIRASLTLGPAPA